MRPVERIGALIPAAGSSHRMGTLNKALLPFGRFTAVEMAVSLFRRAGIRDIRVVAGHASEEITPLLDRLGVKWVLNENHRCGMFSSILAGARDLEPDAPAFFLLPVDIPLVRLETVETLFDAYRKSRKGIIYPRFQIRRGHPPLVSTHYISKDIPPDYPGGLRALLRQYEGEALDVDVPDEAILMDCDTPEDYRKLLEMAGL